jgi:ABC-type nitrate/sulfonate/bicarbonate transport system substrate-binding protein
MKFIPLIAALFTVACSAGAPAASTQPPAAAAVSNPAPPTAASNTAGVAPTSAGPALPVPTAASRLPVRILVTITDRCCLNYIPALVGARVGAFEQNGLDVNWIPQVPGAAASMAATLSGQADVTLISAPGAVAAAGAGRPARTFSVETYDAWPGMAIQPEIAAKLATQGVTPKSSWRDKLRALVGLRVFSSSAGGPAEIRLRKMFAGAGVDPNTIVFQPGEPEAANPAWRSKQLDTFTCCEPVTFQLVPDAVVWLEPEEVDLPLGGYAEIFATTVPFAQNNPETLRRVIATQKQMKQMILAAGPGTKERDAILTALVAQYPTIPPDLIATSFDTGRQEFDIDNEATRQTAQDTIDSYNAGATAQVNLTPDQLIAQGFLKD